MFSRFVYLFWMFVSQYSYFYINNFFTRTLFGLPSNNRLVLVKNITKRLEKINIVYVKVFQSLCLEQGILRDEEKDYLMKYIDSVPYVNSDIDYKVLDKLQEEFDIAVENKTPVNAGIVGIVFKGIHKGDNNRRIVVKMLKQDIVNRYNEAYSDLESLVKYLEWIPYINYINYVKMINDSKECILNQTDFIKECNNIEFFNQKYKNNKEFVLPEVYADITKTYNNIIVMTDITGLRYNDIKNYDENIKYEFAKLFNKFAFLGTLYYSCLQGDYHAGNVFFYLNDNIDTNTDEKPKYQLGVIDFGLCYYSVPENQNAYYTFFYNIQVKKEFDKIVDVLPALLENKDYYYTFSVLRKEMFINEVIDCIKNYSNKNFDIRFFVNLSKIFKSYGLLYTKEFNNMCMSLQITNSIGLALSPKINKIQDELMNEFVKINKLIEIPD